MSVTNWSRFKVCILAARGIRDAKDEGDRVFFRGRKETAFVTARFTRPRLAEPYELVVSPAPKDIWEIADYPEGTLVLSDDGLILKGRKPQASQYMPESLYGTILPYDKWSLNVVGGSVKIMRAPKAAETSSLRLSRGEPLEPRLSYAEFLQTDAWVALKRDVKNRSGRLCEVCLLAGVQRPSNEVHHIRYPKTPGEELIDDLLDVCSQHHRQLHGLNPDEGPTITFRRAGDET